MFTSQIAATTPKISTSNADKNANDVGKMEFMRMLVAQLQHQDPLSPVESQDFSAQLAQFSSLDELSQINELLQQSVGNDLLVTQSINNTLATNLIGKEITALGSRVEFDGENPVDLNYMLTSYAESVTVKVVDTAGNVVKTIESKGVAPGNRALEWDGTGDDGQEMAEGTYSFEVSAVGSNGAELEAIELIRGIATSLTYEGGNAVLKVGEIMLSLSDVLEISSGKDMQL